MKINNGEIICNSKPDFGSVNIKTRGWLLRRHPELKISIDKSIEDVPELKKIFENRNGELIFKMRKKSVLFGEAFDTPMTDYYLNITANELIQKDKTNKFEKKYICSVRNDVDTDGRGFYAAVKRFANSVNCALNQQS